MKKFLKIIAVIGGVVFASTGAFAEDAVKERQSLMKVVGASMGTTVKMLRGKTPFDATKAEEALKAMASAAEKFPTLFPEGTDSTKVATSEASAKIWESTEDFKKQASALVDAATKGAEAAKKDQDALKGAFKAIAATCSSCHQAYRVKKN